MRVLSARSINTARAGTEGPLRSMVPVRAPAPSHSQHHHHQLQHRCGLRGSVLCRKGLGDDLLDFIEAGPKMRKWYGAPEREEGPPEDWEPPPEMEEYEEDEGDGSAILVLDAESAMGEQVVLQLILARADIKICVKDAMSARNSYGNYAKPVTTNVNDAASMKAALKGVGSVVIPGKAGSVLKVAREAGVSHIVMLSAAGFSKQGNILTSLFDQETSMLRDTSREAELAGSGVRYTIVRAPAITDAPGGRSALSLCQGPAASGVSYPDAPVAREDLAGLVVATLMYPPVTGGRTLQMMNLGSGTPPDEWVTLLKDLKEEDIPCAIA